MTRKPWIHLVPAVLLALGVILATAVSVWAADSQWLVLTGPLVLALALLGADALTSRLRGEPFVPSWLGLVMGAVFLGASLIVALADPTRVALLIPVLGAGCAGTMFALNAEVQRTACRKL